jgi:protease PrsW
MDFLLLLALAIAPGIAITMFIFFRDKYEKEPLKLLLFCFLLGLLTIIPPIIVETVSAVLGINENSGVIGSAIYAFLIVGLSEEGSKFLLLRVYPFRNKAFNEPFDGIVYAVMISMGFATAENIFYVIDGGVSVGIARMFTAVPAHASFAVLMGFFAGMAKFRKNSGGLLFTGLVAAVIAHGFYDFFLFQNDYPIVHIFAFIGLIVAVILSFRAIKIHRINSPFQLNISDNQQNINRENI